MKDTIKMNCYSCDKEVYDKSPLKDGQAQSFGKYRMGECIKMICVDCIKDPQKRKVYLED